MNDWNILRYCTTSEDGNKAWYLNGELHRLDGPAVELRNGYKAWFQHNKPHRLDGPAVDSNNKYQCYKNWYLYGRRHRLDGPAVITYCRYGYIYIEYYMKNEKMRDEPFKITL